MQVAVLGATPDARTLAARCATAGHDVGLRAPDANVVMDAIDAIERGDDAAAGERIDGTTGLEAAASDADVVVDATEDDPPARRELLADVEDVAGEDALVAVRCRDTAVTAVAAGLRRPDRAVGLHLVTPADADVVEVVVADQTAESARDRAVEFVEGIDATPLVVRDAPGFASARLDLAQIVEGVRLLEEGVAGVRDVDRAMELGRDHPAGPLARADQLGLDRVLAALEDLADRLDGRFDPPGLLRQKVDSGALGVATGEGFYVWEGGERVEPAEPNPEVNARPDERASPDDV